MPENPEQGILRKVSMGLSLAAGSLILVSCAGSDHAEERLAVMGEQMRHEQPATTIAEAEPDTTQPTGSPASVPVESTPSLTQDIPSLTTELIKEQAAKASIPGAEASPIIQLSPLSINVAPLIGELLGSPRPAPVPSASTTPSPESSDLSPAPPTPETSQETPELADVSPPQELTPEQWAATKPPSEGYTPEQWAAIPPPAGGQDLGDFTTSCYCLDTNNTAKGTRPKLGVVAVDPSLFPEVFDKRNATAVLYIPGYGPAWVLDTGGKIKGKRLDVWLANRPDCFQWGIRDVHVSRIR